MNATTAVLFREVRARKDLLLLALALMGLVLLLPLIPGVRGQSPLEVWRFASSALAIGLGWLMAIALGAKTFGSDLSESRLGFFFCRPVGSVAMWHGRILGAFGVVIICELIILVPALISFRSFSKGAWITLAWMGVWLILIPGFLLLLAHAVSVMVRSRSLFLVLDLLGVTATAGVVMTAIRPFLNVGADLAATVAGLVFVAAAAAALGAAGLVGLIVGRTDSRRTHSAMSLTLWTCMAATAYGAFSYSQWLDDFGPDALGKTYPVAADEGWNWVVVAGSAPGRFDIPEAVCRLDRGRPLVEASNGPKRWLVGE